MSHTSGKNFFFSCMCQPNRSMHQRLSSFYSSFRVKHMIAENDLVSKVFSARLERSVSLEPYNLNLSMRLWVCSLCRSGASPELELNEETG